MQTIAWWCQQTFCFQKFVDNNQQCFASIFQTNFPVRNLNFHWRWRWWDWIQATFLNLFYINPNYDDWFYQIYDDFTQIAQEFKTCVLYFGLIGEKCDNYVPQWWVEFDDELSWLFTNRLSANRPDKWKLREWE